MGRPDRILDLLAPHLPVWKKMLILKMMKHLPLSIIIFGNLHQLWPEQVLQEVLIYYLRTQRSFFDQDLVNICSL